MLSSRFVRKGYFQLIALPTPKKGQVGFHLSTAQRVICLAGDETRPFVDLAHIPQRLASARQPKLEPLRQPLAPQAEAAAGMLMLAFWHLPIERHRKVTGRERGLQAG
jgi:hypothetical protein